MHLHFYIFTYPYIHIYPPQSYIHTSLLLYIHTFIHSYIFIPLYIHTSLQHLYAHTSLHPHIHAFMCTHALIHSYIHTHSCIHTFMLLYIHTYLHSHIHSFVLCTFVYIHPYTHTLIRTPHIHTLFHAFQQSCINIFTLLFEYMKYEWVNVWL